MIIRYKMPRINQYLYNKADKYGIPLGGTFELTPLCNMDCKMCYIHLYPGQLKEPMLSVKEWLELGRQAKEQGMLFLLLTGGEPFLRSEFKEIYCGLHEMGLILSINTNGTLIDEETVRWLSDFPPSRVNITIYGASNETYGKLCGNPKGFDQVMNGIHLLKEAGIEVKLNYSVTPQNAEDLYEVKKIAIKEKLFMQISTYMYPPLRKGEDLVGSNNRFSPQKAADYMALAYYYDIGPKAFIHNVEQADYTQELLDCIIPRSSSVDGEREHLRCRAGLSTFWMTWNGKMTPCGMMDRPAVDVRKAGFKEAWKVILQETKKILMPSKCTGCELKDICKVCAAMVLTETGGFDTVPEYRCKMMAAYPKACHELKGKILAHELKKDVWKYEDKIDEE